MLVARANEWVKRHNLKQEEQEKKCKLEEICQKKLEKTFPTN